MVNKRNNNGSGTAKIRLPLIPLSPLTQTSIEYAKALAQTAQSLSETTTEGVSSTNNNTTNTSDIISILNKDFSKEREKLDRLTKEIQNIQSQFLADLNNYEIAKEIAYINCSLYRLVVLDKNWILNFDNQSNMVPLLDFHRYLSHSISHQIIYSIVEEEGRSKNNKRMSLIGSSSNNNNAIAQIIQIAYILLHIYRDFSGCTAMLTSLQMPEVQRLDILWGQCPSKLVSVYKELVAMFSPHNNYEAYQHYLWLHTARFLNATTPLMKSQMIAVPFMHAHLAMIRNLIHTHSVVAINNSNQRVNNNNVLSDAGEKIFLSAIHVLEFCQHHSRIDPADLEVVVPTTGSSRRLSISSNRRNSLNSVSGLKLSISPCLELDRLHSNPSKYHWLVSRPYLTRSQLHQESLQMEPLAIGEIELEAEEEYDLYWDFFSQPADIRVVAAVNQHKAPISKMQQREEQQQSEAHEQNVVDDLIIVASHDQSIIDNKQQQNEAAEQSQVDSAIVAQNSDTVCSPTSTAENTTIDLHTTKEYYTVKKEAFVEEEDNQRAIIQQEGEAELADTQKIEEEDDDDQTDIIIVAEEEENNQFRLLSNNINVVESPTRIEIKRDCSNIDDGIIAEETKEASSSAAAAVAKPILSPTAPEFVPQHEAQSSSDDDDMVILTEGTSASSSNDIIEEEEEEEWTGYPLENSVSQIDENNGIEEEEEEEWTGYPITNPDEEDATADDDEEEVWKGYPVQQQQNSSTRTIELSSPLALPQEDQYSQQQVIGENQSSNEDEEWKGYKKTHEEETPEATNEIILPKVVQAVSKDYSTSWDDGNNKHHQLHAIGKAAARRMQYSVSNTDNRKRLPSSFTPSAST